ncbi:MAG: hypothetical protein JO336_23060, partial [Acidobacteriia bacterium]|nr:hypothetical protein [Terriglobia bacterium]MBV8902764.1 hypothetical protein [Terriglobia bacterium]
MVPILLPAEAVTLDFEGYPDSTILTNQYLGVTFSNAIVLTAGISLNELEFPPHSGMNVASDNGGPLSILFASPIASFSGYFTYAEPLALDAFGPGNNLIALATSAFSNNEAISGDPGSTPNELLQVSSNSGISLITITGDPAGGSFALDDATYSLPSTSVPEPPLWAMVALVFAALSIAVFRRALSRAASLVVTLVLLCGAAKTAPSLGTVSARPGVIAPAQPANVLVTAVITDPTVLPGVNLLQVDSTGKSLAILGQLHDDGKNGDAVAGDKVFSLVATLNEPAVGNVYLRISAPFQGVLQRVLSDIISIIVSQLTGLPPDPATVAPPLSTSSTTPLGQATSFLYTGPNPIQTGVDSTKMIPAAAGVVRGRVLAADDSPLPGVQITILNHPEFGKTLTRADGWFDMAVNAGG